jgi:hypothetical protein
MRLIRAMVKGNQRKEFDLVAQREEVIKHIKDGWIWESMLVDGKIKWPK